MTNQPHHQDDPSASGKWGIDSFTIRELHVKYIDSMESTPQLLAYRQQYEVKYDVDLHFPGNTATIRMHVLVNGCPGTVSLAGCRLIMNYCVHIKVRLPEMILRPKTWSFSSLTRICPCRTISWPWPNLCLLGPISCHRLIWMARLGERLMIWSNPRNPIRDPAN